MLAQNLMTCHNLWRDASYTCLPLLFEDTCFGNPGSYGPCNSVGSSAQSDASTSPSAGGTFTSYQSIGHLGDLSYVYSVRKVLRALHTPLPRPLHALSRDLCHL